MGILDSPYDGKEIHSETYKGYEIVVELGSWSIRSNSRKISVEVSRPDGRYLTTKRSKCYRRTAILGRRLRPRVKDLRNEANDLVEEAKEEIDDELLEKIIDWYGTQVIDNLEVKE